MLDRRRHVKFASTLAPIYATHAAWFAGCKNKNAVLSFALSFFPVLYSVFDYTTTDRLSGRFPSVSEEGSRQSQDPRIFSQLPYVQAGSCTAAPATAGSLSKGRCRKCMRLRE